MFLPEAFRFHFASLGLFLSSLLGGWLLCQSLQAKPPNVLLIVSDDQGYNDLGLLGNGIITPNLDRIAREGVRLTNFYVAWSACTPSRGALLTGRYPQRNGIYDMIRNEAPDYGHKYSAAEYEMTFERVGGMDEREILLPQVLSVRGYSSAIYGKWDLGSLKRFLPTSRGFDDFYGFVNTGIDYFTHERYGVPSMYRNFEQTQGDKGTYCTYLFEREALRFLQERDVAQPFFLYLPFNAPHGSSALEPEIRSTVQAPPEFTKLYPSVVPEFQTLDKFRYGTNTRVATPAKRQRDYRAAVTCMDAAIGKVLDSIEQQGELDNTIVIFMSDNGGSGGADNSPLRGHKSTMWEGGIRVPCLIRWPSGALPTGTVNDGFFTSLEVFPSLLSACAEGSSPQPPPAELILDGFDWWKSLRGEEPSPRTEMFWQRKADVAVRVGHWKWVNMERTGGLFDLSIDIGEQHDLSKKMPEVLEQVKVRYANWLQEMERAEPRGPFRDF